MCPDHFTTLILPIVITKPITQSTKSIKNGGYLFPKRVQQKAGSGTEANKSSRSGALDTSSPRGAKVEERFTRVVFNGAIMDTQDAKWYDDEPPRCMISGRQLLTAAGS